MAYSFVEYDGRVARVNDADLAAVICLLIDTTAEVEIGERLREHIRGWADQLQVWGPGCADLKLDSALREVSDRRDFLSVVESAKAKANLFGEAIPGNYLNERLGLDGIMARTSLPVGLVRQVFQQLEEVIRGK